MAKESFFQKIDEQIFRQVDRLKEQPFFVRIQDTLLSTEENLKNVLSYVGSFSFLIIPGLILLIFFWSNQSIRKNIRIKTEALEKATHIIALSKNITDWQSVLAEPAITDQQSFSNRVLGPLSQLKIDTQKVQLQEFSSGTRGSFQEATLSLRFNNFDSQELTDWLKILTQSPQLKIKEISLSRVSNDRKIEGSVVLNHLSKGGI